jgi:DNA replicative helicase MCM subunit Mcm2 (Cdc46/Mcm family)
VVTEIVKNLCERDPDGTAFYDDIVKDAEERGIAESTVERILEAMKAQGEIYPVKVGGKRYRMLPA